MAETKYDYDLIVIGGGSGGLAAAKRAAQQHGKKVAVVERARLGGTCVNVGCVPKKVMFMASNLAETMKHDAAQYGFDQPNVKHSWKVLKEKRDKYIAKLNGIYGNGLENASVTRIEGDATFTDPHTIEVTLSEGDTQKKTMTADKIVIATGGRPSMLSSMPGSQHAISSDGFFDLEELPGKVVVVGGGYIAVELSGVFNGLGSDTHLVVRKGKALRTFDDDITDHLDREMQRLGLTIHRNTGGIKAIDFNVDTKKKTVHLIEGEPIKDVDVVLLATGRLPNTDTLNLDKIGVKVSDGSKKFIEVDEYQNTSVENIYALGDVCGKVELTPMAIAAGRRLSDRLFGDRPDSKTSYDRVPTVIFSHPPIGAIGLTESEAVEKFGKDNINVYRSKFPNLYYGVFDLESKDKPQTVMKIVTAGKDELVVGLHVIGLGADEMVQGFGVAMKMGATKSDFDSTIAVHPTASEELVTMGVWGMAPQVSGAKHSPLMGAPPPQPKL